MVFRKNATNGIWCLALVPTILWLEYSRKPCNHENHNILLFLSSILMSFMAMVIYCKYIFSATIDIEKLSCDINALGFCTYIIKQLFYDLFERKLSTVVRKLRQASTTISSKLQPSTIAEARRIRAYSRKIKKGSTSTSPLAPKLIPGEDRKRSLERKILGSGIEPIIESPALAQRKKSSLVEIIKGCIASNVSSPTHLLVPPDDEIYMYHLESITSNESQKFLNKLIIMTTIMITIVRWLFLEWKFNFYHPLSIGISTYIFVQFLPKIFMTFKKQFSFGEGCLITQSLIVFTISTLNDFMIVSPIQMEYYSTTILLIVKGYLVTIIFAICLPFVVPLPMNQIRKRKCALLCIGVSLILNICFWKKMGLNPLKFILDYTMANAARAYLTVSWITLLMIFVSLHCIQSSHNIFSHNEGTIESSNKSNTKMQMNTKEKRDKKVNNEFTTLFLTLISVLLYIISLLVDVNLSCLISSFLLGIVLLSSCRNWVKMTMMVDILIESLSSKFDFFQQSSSKEVSDHYSDYLIDPDSNDIYVTQRTRRLKRNRILVCNWIYTMTNLSWPIWIMVGRMDSVWFEETSPQPPFMNLLGLLPICVGFPVSFICNKKIRRKTHISDTEETIESLIFSVTAQVLVFWLIKKCFILARVCMAGGQDLLQISLISENKILVLCMSIALIQIFCTQSRFLVISPILYIMSYLS